MGGLVHLVDGHAQFHRAYHAIRTPMSSPLTGEPTNLVFGFSNMLAKVLREQRPEHLVVAIDASGDRGTFRSRIDPEYKANREAPPEDFGPQVDRCLELLKALGIPVVAVEGVEADDAIASLVARWRREDPDIEIRILSRDKDLAQITDERTRLFDPQADAFVDTEKLFGRPGLEPRQVPDVLALMGDTVDNVPGVPGVGPKTAAELVIRYGSLDELLAHADELKGKRGEAIRDAAELVRRSRRLVELKSDLEIDLPLARARLEFDRADPEAVDGLMRTLGFNRLREEFAQLLGHEPPPTAAAQEAPSAASREGLLFAEGFEDEAEEIFTPPTTIVRTPRELAALATRVREAIDSGRPIAFDVETTGLVPRRAALCGLSLAFDGEEGMYVPIRSPEASKHLAASEVLAGLGPLWSDPRVVLLGHNLRFDLVSLRSAGAAFAGRVIDTMIESHLVAPIGAGHALKDVAERVLGIRPRRIETLIGERRGGAQKSFDEVPLSEAAPYAVQDAVLAWRLHERFAERIEEAGQAALCRDVEFPLVAVLAGLEFEGIRVDPDELDRQREVLERDLDRLRREIVEAAPAPFSPDSPKQLAAVLFGDPDGDPPGLGLRPLRKGKTGPSTDSETLGRLEADPDIETPLPGLVLEYRGLSKLVGTYLIALKQAINPETGRIHATFHQAATATGRLSSSDPNLQNIPIRTARGREIRKAFKAADGAMLLSADYSQIELRVLAHLSGDPGLVEAFREDRDIHVSVAAEVFGVPPAEVTSEMRGVAKMVNFGIVYGITAAGLARRLGGDTTRERAAEIIETYKARFSGIDAFLEACVSKARTDGYVETILGRRRPIPQIGSRNPSERAFGERAAINTVVQGSAADLIKVAMVGLDRRLREAGSPARMLLQIHDELVLEVPRDQLDAAKSLLVETMEQAMTLDVPLRVDSAWAANWFDAS
ncbi:MAG: DNA polymerase I [Planctomycetota bacterium]|jgi:DNA polymerase-1|nr:DNA polymerase I [Planctomycetota bacterium]